jgi:hypothetical protein
MTICKECPKNASFGYNKPEYCKLHKKEDMTNIKDKRCKEQECNKFAHSGYDPLDEEIRYVYMIHSGKWIFIRFNPDGGKVDLFPEGKRQPQGLDYEVAIEDKLKVLIREEQIRRIENEENEGLLEIVKLYY